MEKICNIFLDRQIFTDLLVRLNFEKMGKMALDRSAGYCHAKAEGRGMSFKSGASGEEQEFLWKGAEGALKHE